MPTIEEQMMQRCRHFNGLFQNDECEMHIRYADVRYLPEQGMAKWPCTSPDIRHLCPQWEPHTAEEIEELEHGATEFLLEMKKLISKETDICFRCHKPVIMLEEIGGSVYADHGDGQKCRLYLGSLPEAWRPEVELASMDMIVATGFGIAQIIKGDEVIFDGDMGNEDDWHELSEFEAMAQADPDHEWICEIVGPTYARTYKREGKERWVLTSRGPGIMEMD